MEGAARSSNRSRTVPPRPFMPECAIGIDPQRFVPLRIEIFSIQRGSSGESILLASPAMRDTTPFQPVSPCTASRKNSVTEFNGARIDQGVQFTDADFTPSGLPKSLGG
jgi:hypothetical protein